jgi:hypothetical protein
VAGLSRSVRMARLRLTRLGNSVLPAAVRVQR